MTLQVIILNYNNYSGLKKCLLSLSNQKVPQNFTLKILIIDNASADGSGLKIKAEFPNYDYIFNQENLGFARGVNQGFKFSPDQADYYLLLNHDASLTESTIEKLLAAEADLAGPTIVYGHDPKRIWQAGGSYKLWKMGLAVPLKNKTTAEIKPDASDDVSFLSACVLLIKGSVLKKIGYLDEDFFFYGEDLDFCLRAKKAGLKISYVSSAQAQHDIQDIRVTRTSPFVLKNLSASYIIIIRKHFFWLLPYGLLLWMLVYTPFRLYQIIKGRQAIKNISAWLLGGWEALNKKINSERVQKI